MHINEVGQWAVMWLNGHGGKVRSAWAFFHDKAEAIFFMNNRGGELYQRLCDGKLARVTA